MTIALTVALLSVVPSANAEEGDIRGRDLFMQGIEAFLGEDYESALQAFRLSYQVNPVASVLYNIAMCHRALVQYVESIEAFEQYLTDGDERILVERRQEVEGLIRDMLQLVGRLRLSVTPAEANVEIDDLPVEIEAGSTLRLAGGPHTIRINRDGFQQLVRQVDLPIGVVTELELHLEPSRDGPAEPTGRPWYRTWWFWTIVGVAVASGVGVGLGVGLTQDDGVGSGDWDVRLP